MSYRRGRNSGLYLRNVKVAIPLRMTQAEDFTASISGDFSTRISNRYTLIVKRAGD